MNPIPHVLTQIVLALLIDAAVLVACGMRVAVSAVVVFSIGLCIWVVLAIQYYVRRAIVSHTPSAIRRRDDWLMLMFAVLGITAPLIAAAWLAGSTFEGLLPRSPWMPVAGTMLLISSCAILDSSAADWYVITPFQRGVLNGPVCDRRIDEKTRSMYAKWWVAHRGACELVAYSGFAFFLIIVFQALTDLFEADDVLKDSLGGLFGAGTAAALMSHVISKRVIPAWEFMHAQSAGLGSWARDVKMDDGREGLIVDVSLAPGIQLRASVDEPAVFVPLNRAHDVQHCASPRPLCERRCAGWVQSCDVGLRHKREAVQSGDDRADAPEEGTSP